VIDPAQRALADAAHRTYTFKTLPLYPSAVISSNSEFPPVLLLFVIMLLPAATKDSVVFSWFEKLTGKGTPDGNGKKKTEVFVEVLPPDDDIYQENVVIPPTVFHRYFLLPGEAQLVIVPISPSPDENSRETTPLLVSVAWAPDVKNPVSSI